MNQVDQDEDRSGTEAPLVAHNHHRHEAKHKHSTPLGRAGAHSPGANANIYYDAKGLPMGSPYHGHHGLPPPGMVPPLPPPMYQLHQNMAAQQQQQHQHMLMLNMLKSAEKGAAMLAEVSSMAARMGPPMAVSR